MKTYRAKTNEINHKWFVVDAKDKVLGRIAVEISKVLMGKHKIIYSPDVDCGDFVIVLNADKVALTGKKAEDKVYYRHSGYVGGLKTETFADKLKKHPEDIIKIAVKGMLPSNKMGRTCLARLKVYTGNEHDNKAQNPEVLNI